MMKKTALVLTLLAILSGASFAGGPVNTPSIEELKKPKMVAVEYVYDSMSKVKKHFTCGLGFGGNPEVGYVEKDGFGYPKCEYGITWVLGYGYTWVSGQPTARQIQNALEAIRSRYGAFVEESKIASMVRKETGINCLNYAEFGTVALIVPLNLEMGKMWILNDNTRTRLGFGLPTLVSFGINFDF